ncbi:zf-HC2 domain-containing protein [Lentzea nigeriaca]|uniref:zf-HC2 domain-containing protein n=1 Tax=Lentzea nigeriaca TaxID=1128665 RepID=UPI00195E33A7|nr:zf-HC2 domain-containing protein [Lentzea nigeriaca]MBM7862054.1 anti-sigma factor RsiW [Lentzea nigeriaca]
MNDGNRTSPDGPCGDVAAYVLGVLDPAQHVIFSRHLAGCQSCRRDAADFGVFAPVLRQVVSQPEAPRQFPVTRSILLVAAGVVVAIAAVLSVAESLASHVDDAVEVGTLTRAEPVRGEPFPLFRHV